MFLWTILALFIILFDQGVKLWVENCIGIYETIHAIPGLIDFVYVKNTGAAFSFLAEKSYGIILLSCISVIFCAAVIIYIVKKKPDNKLYLTALSLMFSGAFGNVIDRLFRGYVVDFIETKFMSFPVFNIADIAITTGAVLMIIYVIFFDKKESENKQVIGDK